MDASTIASAAVAAPAASINFIDLFIQADIIVKSVITGLLISSIWIWAIIFEKFTTMRKLKARAQLFEETFWSGGSLEKLYERVAKRPNDPMIATFVAGMREWQSGGTLIAQNMGSSVLARVERVMNNTITREIEKLGKRMTFLASIGSAGPFIGLFGTVWGIMRSFTNIAASENTSLAVVAPGIAEALLATGVGLVAAIPAVIAYNKFSTDLNRYAERLDTFASDFLAVLARNLDEAEAQKSQRAIPMQPPAQPAPRFGT